MPLHSIRILDLTRLLPGPYATMILADFGAEVIKIEDPYLGDYTRFFEPQIGGMSVLFHTLNRNKESITLDLKSEKDKEIFLELVDDADVVIESFRPHVMKRLGLDYDMLKARNPRLVYCAITGYGQTGPYKEKAGHDINYLSDAGLLNLMGTRGGPPIIPATTIADIGAGALPAVIGILIALHHQRETGEGQLVDIGMMDGVIAWLATLLPNYLNGGIMPARGEQMLDGGRANYNVYETKDGRYLAVGAIEEKFWSAFCQAIGREEFIPLLDSPLKQQNELQVAIQEIMLMKDLDEWLQTFSSIEACVSPVQTFAELVTDPQVQAREMIQTIVDEELGTVKQIGIPIKLSKTPGKIRSLAPKYQRSNQL